MRWWFSGTRIVYARGYIKNHVPQIRLSNDSCTHTLPHALDEVMADVQILQKTLWDNTLSASNDIRTRMFSAFNNTL